MTSKVLLLLLYLLILSVFDIKSQRVPVVLLTIGSMGIVISVLWELMIRRQTLLEAALGVIPGIVFLIIAWLSQKAGYADGIILIWMGALFGYRISVLVFGVSLMLASICSIVLLMLRKVNRQSQLPYIPFLAAGMGIVLLSM